MTCCSFCAPHLEFVYSFVLHSYNQGWLATQKKKNFFFFFFFFFFVVASPALVVGMQDNEYTDAQVGDAGGLFKSLDPAPCGAVPVYPHPVLQFQSTSVPVYLIQRSSAPIPVYLIQYSSSSLPHPALQY